MSKVKWWCLLMSGDRCFFWESGFINSQQQILHRARWISCTWFLKAIKFIHNLWWINSSASIATAEVCFPGNLCLVANDFLSSQRYKLCEVLLGRAVMRWHVCIHSFSDGLSLCEKDQDVSCRKFVRTNYSISMKLFLIYLSIDNIRLYLINGGILPTDTIHDILDVIGYQRHCGVLVDMSKACRKHSVFFLGSQHAGRMPKGISNSTELSPSSSLSVLESWALISKCTHAIKYFKENPTSQLSPFFIFKIYIYTLLCYLGWVRGYSDCYLERVFSSRVSHCGTRKALSAKPGFPNSSAVLYICLHCNPQALPKAHHCISQYSHCFHWYAIWGIILYFVCSQTHCYCTLLLAATAPVLDDPLTNTGTTLLPLPVTS